MKNLKKIVSIALIIILILNLTLFVLKRMDAMAFWIITAVIALAAYKGVPHIKD